MRVGVGAGVYVRVGMSVVSTCVRARVCVWRGGGGGRACLFACDSHRHNNFSLTSNIRFDCISDNTI